MDTADSKALQREILLGFWKIHILHHAAQGPVVGQWMLQELRHHGYEVSPGTLYPLLHRMERLGWLCCTGAEGAGPKARRPLRATARGREVLAAALRQLQELQSETTQPDARPQAPSPGPAGAEES
ncbi:PadR family transcriptional regulator [Desulfocurvus vexinensis]|uniref:PadR family transcriptional regulator n=1 Tax=Desulfocurvus vexinensis TaxID=399548 RepID=UPI0004AE38F6|nr:PadR family transcriptional regulator [Desulfocurvus vexinensis]